MPFDPVTGEFTPLYDWEREGAAREKLTLPRLKEQDDDMAKAITGLLQGGLDDGVYAPSKVVVPVAEPPPPSVLDDGTY
jgi:hypothetical protein